MNPHNPEGARPRGTSPDAARDSVRAVLRAIRGRWRRRTLVRGGTLTLLVGLLLATVMLLTLALVPVTPGQAALGVVVAGTDRQRACMFNTSQQHIPQAWVRPILIACQPDCIRPGRYQRLATA